MRPSVAWFAIPLILKIDLLTAPSAPSHPASCGPTCNETMAKLSLRQKNSQIFCCSKSLYRNLILSERENKFDEIRLCVTRIRCKGLPTHKSLVSRTNPFIIFLSDPEELIRLPRTKEEKFISKLGLARNKTKMDNNEGVLVKMRDGWPRTSVIKNTRDPDWEDLTIHFHLKMLELSASGKKYQGSMSASTKDDIDPMGALLHMAVMDHNGVEPQMIGVASISLRALLGEAGGGLGSTRRLSFERHDSKRPSSVHVEQPIVLFGREQGTLSCDFSACSNDGIPGIAWPPRE